LDHITNFYVYFIIYNCKEETQKYPPYSHIIYIIPVYYYVGVRGVGYQKHYFQVMIALLQETSDVNPFYVQF